MYKFPEMTKTDSRKKTENLNKPITTSKDIDSVVKILPTQKTQDQTASLANSLPNTQRINTGPS